MGRIPQRRQRIGAFLIEEHVGSLRRATDKLGYDGDDDNDDALHPRSTELTP